MIEKRLIKRKLSKLREYLTELQPFVNISFEDYISYKINNRDISINRIKIPILKGN